MTPHRFIRAAALSLAAIFLLPPLCQAQSYPNRPVHMIISLPPGGITDSLARILSDRLAAQMSQTVLVDNRPGGNYVIAAEAAARALPDGYTLFLAVDSTFTLNPLQDTRLNYDFDRDFAPISLVALQSLFMVASGKGTITSFSELLAQARARPGQISFGTSALLPQLIGEQIKVAAGINMVHVPFKGSPPMLQALLSGDLDLSITTFLPYAAYTKDGRLRGLAVTGPGRETASPETPSLAELGYPDLGAQLWFGLVAPAATPAAILKRLQSEVQRALTDPDTRQRFLTAGVVPAPGTAEEFRTQVHNDLAKWTRVVKAAGIALGN